MTKEEFEKQRKEDNEKLIADTFKAEMEESKLGLKQVLYYFIGHFIAWIIIDFITARVDMPYIVKILVYAVIFTILVEIEMLVVRLIKKRKQ